MPENVTISFERYWELLEAENFLSALQGAGVDNWEGYDYARESCGDITEADALKSAEQELK